MMERDYVDIIKEKEFIELNPAERAEIAGVCASEEEFNATKAMLLQIDGVIAEPIEPHPKTKESLDNLFSQSYPKAAPIWYNSVLAVIVPKEKPVFRQPLVQIAAALLIFWMVFPFFNSELSPENKQLAKVEKQKETEESVENTLEKETMDNQPEEVKAPSIEQEPAQITDAESPIAMPAPAASRSFPGVADVVGASFDEVMSLEESTHPDGVFMAASGSGVAFGQSAKETADLLDLLTATF